MTELDVWTILMVVPLFIVLWLGVAVLAKIVWNNWSNF
jgi:hypothetical protein